MTYSSQRSTVGVTVTLLTLLLLTTPIRVFAHAGHGDEFQGGGHATQAAGAIQVDAETTKRMGLKVEPVSRQRLAFGIKTTGQIETLPNQQVEVTTPVGGTVIRLLVKPGDSVQAGQPVAMMTSPELAALQTTALDRRAEAVGSVQQGQADLRLAQQNLTQQKRIVATDIQQARTELNFSQERYDKDTVLLEQGAIPRRQFLESESKLAEARAALAKAESGLPVSEAQAQLQRAQSALEVARSRVWLSGQAYETRLRQLGANPNEDGTITITAPISGVVADREATKGESGQDAGKQIMTIVNGSSVQASGNIFEKDLERIAVGQSVRVRSNGMPDRTFNGRINVVGAVVNGETRVVPVKAELDNSGGLLKPGMFVELEVLTDRAPAAVPAIPKSALVTTNDKKQVVFVQNGNAFQPTEVTLGRESGNFVEVKTGLFDGDMIVTQRANQLYAQSLRGDSKPADGHEDKTAESAPASKPQPAIPWWSIIPAGGAIAAGTFAAGMLWANRRNRKAFVPVLNGHAHRESFDNLSLTNADAHISITPTSLESASDRHPHQPR
ncbi:efflux RND transporter periplasmic adaptor subunit [Phormidium sp. CLA17]|uniref:efflux RND transporter periplasmic adaptor subunit n=1 Tax=Leptolyngbya sp. Cla-17 TaxID=2803751 RepID=UPI001492FDD0|nr:efflux RND transporter periplasmic adaptor subunit [Leptolyngbya sp. Cla-17]MBM0742159.1 efflux RND transporter periplasmic adaptor subunit [Leptolyngbya sp. Cla-17]